MPLVNVKLIEGVFTPTQIRRTTPLALALFALLGGGAFLTAQHQDHARIFPTPADAINSPPEKLAYVVATYAGTETKKSDYLATIDVDPQSKTYSQVIHRVRMPQVGDELHHFGWNACGSCQGRCDRRYLIIPGIASSRIHIVDTRNPRRRSCTR